MEDKKLNEVTTVNSGTLANVKTFLAVMKDGTIQQMSKEDLASVVGGLLSNTYNSFTLKNGVEEKIASGTGVYYISNKYLDSVSVLIVINYDSFYILGDDYRVGFRVESSELYATAKIGDQDINVRKLCKK